MKITKIIQDGNIFEVTKEPNALLRFLGWVPTFNKYRDLNVYYRHHPAVRAYSDK